jgi:hypothetical protein
MIVSQEFNHGRRGEAWLFARSSALMTTYDFM